MRNPLRILPVPVAKRWTQRLLTLQALVLVPLAAFAQKAIPMKWWSFVLGSVQAVPDDWKGRRIESVPVLAASQAERYVAVAVRRASRLLPFKPTCLAEATAGQILLRQLSVAGVVVFGLRPTDDGQGPWKAHAWLLGRLGALTGGPAAAGFTPTSVYVVADGLQADEVDFSAST